MMTVETYKDNFVVKDHRSVSSVDKSAGIKATLFGKQGAFLQDRRDISSSLTNLVLACR
jgi:hypothetical protein